MVKQEFENSNKTFEWKATVVKGNSKGTGWVTLPSDKRGMFNLGETYLVKIFFEKKEMSEEILKLTNLKLSWGLYIKKILCNQFELIGKVVKITLQNSDYFSSKLSKENGIRLPEVIVNKYEICKNDIIEIEIKNEEKILRDFVKITRIDRSNLQSKSGEYYFVSKKLKHISGEYFFGKIVKKIPKANHYNAEGTKELIKPSKLFEDAIVGKITEEELIVFSGSKEPIYLKINYDIKEFIHYFGCFYADGTKIGPGFRINASTPQQALYYCSKINQLIKNISLDFDLTYTVKPYDLRSNEKIKEDLQAYWSITANIKIKAEKIYLINTSSEITGKWNKNGSLGIRSYKSLITDFHGRILEYLTKNMQFFSSYTKWQFLFGILEGDGFVSGGKERLGIGIACHGDDEVILPLLDEIQVTYNIDSYKKRLIPKINSFSVLIPLKDILIHLEIFTEYLFRYYPKRRKKFVLRLLEKPTIQSLLKFDLESQYAQKYLINNKFTSIDKMRENLLKLVEEKEKY